jgi:type III secretion protein Q
LRAARLARARQPVPLLDGMDVALVSDTALQWEDAGKPVEIVFTVAGEIGYLRTVTPLIQRLLIHADVRLRPDELDAELAAMVIETVLAERMEELEGRLGAEIAFLNLERSAVRESMASLPLQIRVAEAGAFPGMLFGSAALLSVVARLWEDRPALDPDRDDLSFTLACRVAFTDLDLSALRVLGIGDAMLFDRVAVPGGAAVVIGEALHATAIFDEQGHLTLSEGFLAPERFALGEFLMTDGDDQDRPVQAIMDSAIDDLPVRLVFEVGRKDMTVQELRDLGVGAPVPLDRPASSAVQIFANGRRIGAGEMVMIGDQLGVRITQLNGNA